MIVAKVSQSKPTHVGPSLETAFSHFSPIAGGLRLSAGTRTRRFRQLRVGVGIPDRYRLVSSRPFFVDRRPVAGRILPLLGTRTTLLFRSHRHSQAKFPANHRLPTLGKRGCHCLLRLLRQLEPVAKVAAKTGGTNRTQFRPRSIRSTGSGAAALSAGCSFRPCAASRENTGKSRHPIP